MKEKLLKRLEDLDNELEQISAVEDVSEEAKSLLEIQIKSKKEIIKEILGWCD